MTMIDMNRIVGHHHILFITLDTLRYDVAQSQWERGGLPHIGEYLPQGWEKRHTPGSFTYAAHQAFFAGFLPTPVNEPQAARLFVMEFPGSATISAESWVGNAPDLVSALKGVGYDTLCVGGVGFFNQQSPLGLVLPNLFDEAIWKTKMGVTDSHSTANQVEWIIDYWRHQPASLRFTFLNVSAIHQPNSFYLTGATEDNIDSHAAALRYVDHSLGELFAVCQGLDRPTLVLLMSDHGTCYGDGGYQGHRLAHEVVWTVPYGQFVIEPD